MVLKPGWKWSNDVKPLTNTEWCEAPHFEYQASGTMHVVMKDGTELSTRTPGTSSCCIRATTHGWSARRMSRLSTGAAHTSGASAKVDPSKANEPTRGIPDVRVHLREARGSCGRASGLQSCLCPCPRRRSRASGDTNPSS